MMCCLFPKMKNAIMKPKNRKGLIANPTTIGEKMRNRRIELNLFQRDVATLFKVSEDCITNWENDRSGPQIRYMPTIIRFLGINLYKLENESICEKIKLYRNKYGLSYKNAGKIFKVNGTTVSSWEHGKHRPPKKVLMRIHKFLEVCR